MTRSQVDAIIDRLDAQSAKIDKQEFVETFPELTTKETAMTVQAIIESDIAPKIDSPNRPGTLPANPGGTDATARRTRRRPDHRDGAAAVPRAPRRPGEDARAAAVR